MADKILITGIAGFIGVNTAARFIEKGKKVVGIDNLSRSGVEKNLRWLAQKFNNWEFYFKDIRDRQSMEEIIKKELPDVIIHLAGQVAVTSSVENPHTDREINIDGTLNLLEAARKVNPDSIFLYSSTNKVYGGFEEHDVVKKGKRYLFKNKTLRAYGISEKQNLDFHSPYGCSKGAADQYVRDYFRIYGLPTVVLRQSCIYGRHQFGNEDQGWVIHFVRRAIAKTPISIYGDGKQVRDVLNVEDLVDLYEITIDKIAKTQGQIYNVGGGSKNSVSLLELISLLEKKLKYKVKMKYGDWRPGDQKVFISDIEKAKSLGWSPKVEVSQGIEELIEWARQIQKE